MRDGVATIMSGNSANSERCTASLIFCARLTSRIWLVQYAENIATAFDTCCASSRVGTKIRAEMPLVA